MSRVLLIGAGGVAGVAAAKMTQNPETFGERFTVKRSTRVGRGIGPTICAPVALAVSMIPPTAWSSTRWSYACRRMRTLCCCISCFFLFVSFFRLPAHSRPRFRRAASRRCLRGPFVRAMLGVGCPASSLPSNGQDRIRKAPVAPSRHTRALALLPDASNGNFPSRTVSRTLTLFGLGRVVYQRIPPMTRG